MSLHGFLNIRKPIGMTSRKVVDWAEALLGKEIKMGHAGTLDPLASGVLILALGQAVRFIAYMQDAPKTYRSCFHFGFTSTTDDAEGERTPFPNPLIPEADAVHRSLSHFQGEIEQIPPQFSAVRQRGKRAYKQARKGFNVPLEPRRVHIDRLTVMHYQFPNLELEIECRKGTYIRSLARDLGQRLGCGGYVAQLERTRIGPFTLGQSCPMTYNAAELRAHVEPMDCLASIYPSFRFPPDLVQRIQFGQRFICKAIPEHEPAGMKVILDQQGHFVAMVRIEPGQRYLLPERVWQPNRD